MEKPLQNCEICVKSGPNQTKLPRHYIRRKFKAETHLTRQLIKNSRRVKILLVGINKVK